MARAASNISERIYDDLKRDISGGAYDVGTAVPSENEIAQKYQATRFFARKALARLEAEEIIINRRGVGRLVTQRNQTIRRLGILDEHSFEFYREHDPNMPGHVFDWQQGVFKACGETEVTSIHLTGKSGNLQDRLFLLQQTLESNIDALIFRTGILDRSEASEFLLKVRNCGVPALCMLTRLEPEDHIDSLSGDYYGVGRMLTSHLIENGHANIAYISGELGNNDDNYYRYRGVIETLREHGLPVHEEAFVSVTFTRFEGVWFQNGEYAIQKLQENRALDKITAIIAYNDQMAEGAISKLNELGKRVPEDISIVAFDNDPRCRHLNLTTGYFRFVDDTCRVIKKFIEKVNANREEVIMEKMTPVLVAGRSVRKLAPIGAIP
jgi:DNA-binding LacI/PurR family transcriptional regulator/DNA-binding transcriptional regulator YhcF (GntR family)